jgi:hypothetical protein
MKAQQPVRANRKQRLAQAIIFVFVAVVASVSLAIDHERRKRSS